MEHSVKVARRAELAPFDLWWSSGCCAVGIAGEHFRRSDIAAVVRRHVGSIARRGELSVEVTLEREPDNPHDADAVAVRADDLLVGYLRRAEATGYHGALDRLAAAGLVARTAGEIHWWTDQDDGEITFAVTIDLGSAALVVPINDRPVGARVLPPGRIVGVQGRSDSVAATLTPRVLVVPGHQVSAWALLSSAIDETGRPVTAVAIDGVHVGVLSTSASAELLPVTGWGALHGLPVACRALLVGHGLEVQVTVDVATASELPDDWFDVDTPTVLTAPHPDLLPVASAVDRPFEPAAVPHIAAPLPVPAPPPVPPPSVPAAWHADPSGRHQLRYWDGEAWTEHISNDGTASFDPI